MHLRKGRGICAGLMAGGAALVLAACSPTQAAPQPNVPEETLTQVPEQAAPAEVSEAAIETRDELLKFARAGSLSGISRVAGRNETFISNFGEREHRNYWNLMRRIGADPNLRLRQLFEHPAGVRTVDGVAWYVWPDLAARDAEDLIPEKLTFQERARLTDLVGEEGVQFIRTGGGYPGARTAISEDGLWIYFVLDAEIEPPPETQSDTQPDGGN